VKAMAAAYSAHAGTIGPLEGIPHLLQLLDTTQQRSLRHGLLLLLQALIGPSAAGDLSALNAPVAAAASSSSSSTSLTVAAGGGAGGAGTASLSVNTGAAAAAAGAVGRGVRLSRLPAGQQAAVKAAKANGYLLMDHGGLQLLVDFVAGGVYAVGIVFGRGGGGAEVCCCCLWMGQLYKGTLFYVCLLLWGDGSTASWGKWGLQ
jgi:hypothetical protein